MNRPMHQTQRPQAQRPPHQPIGGAAIQLLQSWASQNPHRKRTVLPIEIRILSDTQEGEVRPSTLPGGWSSTPLEPPGPVIL